jgi:type IV pilus assembly protein PilE
MGLPKGFTLIELMVTVAIVAILAAIAIPSYTDYVRQGKIPEATSALSARRVQAEQYFQDNRTYQNTGAFVNPACVVDTSGKSFDFACTAQAATTYTVQATGKNAMAGFIYTIDQNNNRTSPFSGAPAGWTSHAPDNCWVTKKGGVC